MKVKANQVENFEHCHNPGDFYLTPPDDKYEGGGRRLSFLCPCGCGDLAGIRVRDDGKSTGGAWEWDRNEKCPTCKPSILIGNPANHWHGYLTNGEFVSC